MSEIPAAIGPFVVRRKLGEGGMGLVYEGYDAALDRKVALKLIRRELLGRGEIRGRMLREAQAMARLSHPNVVQIHQVGEHGDEIYVAMEYVEGETLAKWLSSEPRPWQLVLRTVVAAGRGLAAAHVAGLVHRDFKPDNILVGRDGRARVLDFGLVHAGDAFSSAGAMGSPTEVPDLATFSRMSTQAAGDATEPHDILPPERLTQTGRLLGTPVYMSPEQHFGGAVTTWSDQFSFAVTAYEALYGARPFAGETWDELRSQLRLGAVTPPPPDSSVPGRIFRILARGLASTPQHRWPSLSHLLDALERDPRRTFLRVVGVLAIAGLAATASYAVALWQRATVQCRNAASELVGVWDDARAAAAERAFLATGSPFAADTWKRVDVRLDAYASSWIAGRTQACEDHAAGAQSTGLYDLRTACLARRRAYLSALVDVFAAADRSVIENAVQATAALPSADSCTDADALLAAAAPPDDPEVATQVDSLRAQLARAAALENTGQYVTALEHAHAVRVAAEALHYPPLAAEAALGEGSVLIMLARADEADAALTHALSTALVHGLDAVAAEAAAKSIFAAGELQGRRIAALALQSVAEALVIRAGDDGRIEALLHNNLGAVNERDGADERAQEHYLRAIDLLARRAGPADPLIAAAHHNFAGLQLKIGRLEQAREHYKKALSLWATLLGESHPLIAHPISGLAAIDLREDRLAQAREGYTHALALMEASFGAEHLYVLDPLVGLGKIATLMDERDAASAHFRRAVDTGQRLDVTHPIHAEALVGLAELLVASDRAEARALLARAVAVYEADGGPRHPAIAAVALRAGQLAASAGEAAAAREWFERVLSDTTGLESQLVNHALAALELARMLPAGERERACALARQARDGLAAGHPRRGEADTVLASTCR